MENKMNKSESSIYEIGAYTDQELYDILNINNPSDRELEAKINSMIWKYTNIGNESGDKLVKFFENMYDHFFDEEAEEEGEEEEETPEINRNEILRKREEKEESTEEEESNVKLSKPTNYAEGTLNPLLHQYRSNKTALSTDFTFDLSDPLKDVVNLKLYSVQIPLTWYVINSNYGSNFLFIKGSSPGINNGNHDYKITIPMGNYTARELVTAVNTSLQSLKSTSQTSDTDFGTTDITYDYPSSKATLNVDIFKHFNENHYEVEFTQFTTPNQIDRTLSIPGFLGFNRVEYSCYRIYSNLTTLPYVNEITEVTSEDINVANYILTASNNYFNIYHYKSNRQYNSTDINREEFYLPDPSGNFEILDIIRVELSNLEINTSYSRRDLLTEINTQLQSHSKLSALSKLTRVNETDVNTIGYNQSHFELDIRINRGEVKLQENSKLSVIFPNDQVIWQGLTSAFVFETLTNELSTINAETRTIENKYIIQSNPYILLRCIKQYFDISDNEYRFYVENSSSSGYDLSEYMVKINAGIVTENDSTKTVTNIAGDFKINSTRAFINNNTSLFSLQLDLTKTFTQSEYLLDLSGTLMNSIMNYDVSEETMDTVVKFTSTFPVRGAGNLIELTDTLIKILPNPNSTNRNLPAYIVKPTIGKRYTDINEMQTDINAAFSNFVDLDGYPVLQGTNISLSQDGNNINAILTINIRKFLTQNDFELEFVDPSSNVTWQNDDPLNSWAFFLKLGQRTYTLSNAQHNIENTSYAVVLASTAISGNLITLNSFNNRVLIKPVELSDDGDGIYDENGANTITLTLPTGVTYTRDQLILEINNLFETAIASGSNTALATGSLMSIYKIGIDSYVKLQVNVNRTYKAKDYRVVFYDPYSFSTFSIGTNIVTNTTWDATLGWILGFRISTEYYLGDYSEPTDSTITYTSDTRSITGDNVVSVSLYNYFMILLDDYNQNSLNDGVVTTTQKDINIKPPSYAIESEIRAHPITGQALTSTKKRNGQNMTQNEIYAAQEILNSKNVDPTSSIISSSETVSRRTVQYYSSGPFAKNVFALVPLKISGVSNNSIYVEFGGTLQNQQRNYFGPVNIQRMTVKLVNDRGTLVDLNGANWSFSFVCEQLYQQKKL
jgi:hypothetical protein